MIYENRSKIYIPAQDYTAAPEDLMKPIDNPVCVAARVVLNINTIAGSQTVQLVIEGFDALGNPFLLLASTAKGTTGQVVLLVDPRIALSANLIAQAPLPRTWHIRPVHNNLGLVNYSVCYEMLV